MGREGKEGAAGSATEGTQRQDQSERKPSRDFSIEGSINGQTATGSMMLEIMWMDREESEKCQSSFFFAKKKATLRYMQCLIPCLQVGLFLSSANLAGTIHQRRSFHAAELIHLISCPNQPKILEKAETKYRPNRGRQERLVCIIHTASAGKQVRYNSSSLTCLSHPPPTIKFFSRDCSIEIQISRCKREGRTEYKEHRYARNRCGQS